MRQFISTALVATALVGMLPFVAIAQDQQVIKTTETETVETTVPYQVEYVFNRDLGAGRTKKTDNGKDGKVITTFTKFLEDGVVVMMSKSTEVVAPQNAVIQMGTAGFKQASRSKFTRDKVLEMESTAYLPTDGSGSGLTASGRRAAYGVVAVDPRVIPLGTLVFVEGYGFAIAADTGGAIKGNIIDVCMHDRSEAMRWGRRKVTVHIFKGREPKE